MSGPQPAAGAETSRARAAQKAARVDDGDFKVVLEHGRWRHFGWLVIGGGLGVFLVWKLGTVSKGLGIALLVLGAINLIRFARTLLRPAGSIEVSDEAVRLPEGLCRGKSHRVEYGGIRHAFFLRRAVPWTRTGPILVIETDAETFSYPRDWFSSDSDQRRIAHAIHRRLERP